MFFSVGKDSLSVDNMDIEDYEMQTRNALTGEFADGFEFELKESSDKDDKSVQLIWKKVVEKDRIKVHLFIECCFLLLCMHDELFCVFFIACLLSAIITWIWIMEDFVVVKHDVG